MGDNVIILEVILNRATASRTQDLCSSLDNTYYNTNAGANQTYTFGWSALGGMSGAVKLGVGSADVLLEYNGSTQQVEAVGTCNGNDFQLLSVLNDTTLRYTNVGFSFDVQFHLVDGAAIEISVKPNSNTVITAAD